MEIWKDITGYDGYQVSNYGNIRSIAKNKILKQRLNVQLYSVIRIRGKNKRVHRLVAQEFVQNTSYLKEVNHINGVKTDNRSVNLEWCTRSDNCSHAWRSGLRENARKKLIDMNKNAIRLNGRILSYYAT